LDSEEPSLDSSESEGGVVVAKNASGRCVLSADRASHFCGLDAEVSEPPILPHDEGLCRVSKKSGREICFPKYSDLDMSCNDETSSSLSHPPKIAHATVHAMAFVPPEDLKNLLRQYYRKHRMQAPKNFTPPTRAFLVAKMACEHGYELVDEVNMIFCSGKEWVRTLPQCRGLGACANENGGCSDSCLSPDGVNVECHCPSGKILSEDRKTCTIPIPTELCRNLAGCSCAEVDAKQYTCRCPHSKNCLLMSGPPKIYIEPAGPYEIVPGGNINVTCSAVAFPFPDIVWQRNNETVSLPANNNGRVQSSKILIIKELNGNAEYSCFANNTEGSAERKINIIVKGPGSPPVIRAVRPDRTAVSIKWEPPHIVNRPVTGYTIYYTTNKHQPIKNWKTLQVPGDATEWTINDLRPQTQYNIRIRANDELGPGKIGQPVTMTTRDPATRPAIVIPEGEELRVAPLTPFVISCNVTRADPLPTITWEHKTRNGVTLTRGRPVNAGQKSTFITLKSEGLAENTQFACVADNEAGRTTKKINVTITGPSAPERVRYQVDGDKVNLQWNEPKITNGPMAGYDVYYTDDPSLPEDQWKVHRIDDPNARSTTIPGLDEQEPYTFKIRGRNRLGEGVPTPAFTATTWLKGKGKKEGEGKMITLISARSPTVSVAPEGRIELDPSTNELTIECEANGVPKPKIIWLWSGGFVEDGKDEFRVYDVTPIDSSDSTKSKLIASSTTRSGTATCQAINTEGSDEAKVDVHIRGPGSAPLNIKPTPTSDGFDVAWTPPKRTNGRIANYIIYYSKNPDAPLSEWEKLIVDGDQRNATISVGDEDTPYTVKVQAATDDGPGIISEAMDVTTGRRQVPLTVRLEIIDPSVTEGVDTTVEPSQPIHFRCIVEGRPRPSVSYSWLPINTTNESGDEPVPIPVEQDSPDEHRYTSIQVYSTTSTKRILLCTARNPDGSVEDKHVFIVNKPGSPPRDIETIVDDDNRVTINWKPPKHPNGDITSYRVYLTGDPSKPIEQWQVFDVTNPHDLKKEFLRGELEPETPYYVRISAVNPDGEGVKSDPVSFTTVSGAPKDSPKDVVPTVGEDNTVNLTWSGPSDPNGPIQSYTVYFAPDDGTANDDDYKQWQKIEVPSTDDHGGITIPKDEYGLQPNTPYKIRVTATNDLSEGPASDPVTFKTGSGELPPEITIDAPEKPAKVAPKGDIIVTCTAAGVPNPRVYWVLENGDVQEGPVLRITGITRDTSATCHAENNAGKTQSVLPIHVTGPGSAPNEIVALPMPGQGINVEWTTPDDVNGKIDNYVIQYGEIAEGETEPKEWKEAIVPADDVNHQLPDMKPKVPYAIRMKAVSDRGEGPMSQPIVVRTLPLAPEPIKDLTANVHPNNSVTLKFTPPVDPEDPTKNIKDFVISYTTDDPPDDTSEWKEVKYTDPDPKDGTVELMMDGDNFKPDTKFHIRVTPRGEIDGPPSEPTEFTTGDGVVPPGQPEFNVDVPEDNTIKVPPGSDYSISCSAEGFPAPSVRWMDENGKPLSDGPTLKLHDVRKGVKVMCVAENKGGRTERPFNLFVAGPGSAPENVQLNNDKPATIGVTWDPPTITNGNVTKYIVYYTPLDDQNPASQVGQVQNKPINEWMAQHVTPDDPMKGPMKVELKDFVQTDTAYAVVIQAINDNGPGPYSNQYTIRTMSKKREGPPRNLRVEPDGQRSANVDWQEPETMHEKPLSYEIYYIPGDKSIDVDDAVSLSDWTKITVPDPSQLKHRINNLLTPNTDYVFKIRAIYPDGPSVFSEPCLMKTLPDGNAPYIVISTGDSGVDGTSTIEVLPGSAIKVSCNASGTPLPHVRWIKAGTFDIDPSTIREGETFASFSLDVSNITEDTTFNCLATNPLGIANWTIYVNVQPGLKPNWADDLVIAKTDGDTPLLQFTDDLPAYLKPPADWEIHYTTDPSKPRDEWEKVTSDGAPLNKVAVPGMEPGTPYWIVVNSPSKGIETPVIKIETPKPPTDLRVGQNMNGDDVLDFKPAIAQLPIKSYTVKYWPVNEPTNAKQVSSGPDSTQIVIPDLKPDTDYNFQVIAEFHDGSSLPSETSELKTPPGDVECDCAHACTFEEEDDGSLKSICFCNSGFELGDDGKSCSPSETTSVAENIFELSTERPSTGEEPEEIPTTPIGGIQDLIQGTDESGAFLGPDASPLPTDKDGKPVFVDQSKEVEPPTDSSGRVIEPAVLPDGTPLKITPAGDYIDPFGNVVLKDDDGNPLGPNGEALEKDSDGKWKYPFVDKTGQPIPTDESNKPVFNVVDADNNPVTRNEEGQWELPDGTTIDVDEWGRPIGPNGEVIQPNDEGQYVVEDAGGAHVITTSIPSIPKMERMKIVEEDDDGIWKDEDGNTIPTNDEGKPIGPDGKLLPKNEEGKFVVAEGGVITPTQKPSVIGPNGELLPTDASGSPINPDGIPIKTNDAGEPLGPDGNVLPKDDAGNFIYLAVGPDGSPLPTDENKKPVYPVVGPDGQPLATDSTGAVVGPDGEPIPTDASGRPVGAEGSPLPTDANGNYVNVPKEDKFEEHATDESGRILYPIVGPDGFPLATDSTGNYLNEDGSPIEKNDEGRPLGPDGNVLPTDASGNFIYPAVGPDGSPLPTDANNKPVYPVVGPDGQPLATDSTGAVVGPDGQPIPTDASGKPVDASGNVLPTDSNGNYIQPAVGPDGQPLPTDSAGKPVYPVVGPDGQPLATDSTGAVVGPDGQPIPTDASGKPVDASGNVLPTDSNGNYIQPAVGPDGQPLPTDSAGKPVYPVVGSDGQPLATDSTGAVVGPDGQPIPTDASGKPVDASGNVLPTDSNGNYIQPAVGPDGQPLPTDSAGKPVYPVPVDADGNVLPTDSDGKYISPKTEGDDEEKVVLPIIGPDGGPMPTDHSGKAVLEDGSIVKTNDAGEPLGPDGNVLPKDDAGNFIYPAVGPDGSPLPTDENKKPVYPVVGPDGQPLATDSTGAVVGPDGEPIPTDASGRPVGADGSPLPTDANGNYVNVPKEDKSEELATDESGQVVYPIVGPDGKPLATDSTGNYIDKNGNQIGRDEEGRPVDPNGEVLPTDSTGKFIYPALGPDGSPLPTDENQKPVYPILGPDGTPLTTDSTGRLTRPDGDPIPTDESGRPLNIDGEVLPTNEEGSYILPEESPDCELRSINIASSSDILFVIETTEAAFPFIPEIRDTLKEFTRVKTTVQGPKIGTIIYGGTAEVTTDIGRYSNQEELISSFDEIRLNHGPSDVILALKTAVREAESSGRTVVVLHFYATPLRAVYAYDVYDVPCN
ncbi:dig-1, partial [Pristionchus pacificus]